MTIKKNVILSGMQPSGILHLGNYEGALKNWASLQNSGQYEMFFCIVDWHALTTAYDKTTELNNRIFNMAADYIAGGLDPERVTIFVQSDVKQHAELHLLLSMIIPTPWLERVPSYKEKLENLGLDSYGFLGYPLLQAADIMVYRANAVPVGKDQLPHLELTREVVRRFNYLYGEVFPEPKDLLSEMPVVLGSDNRKMSKSYDNYIAMADEPDVLKTKIMGYYTDPTKLRRGDIGHPSTCPVFMLLKTYAPNETDHIESSCTSGSAEWGCVKCKKLLIECLSARFAEFRAKRAEILDDCAQIENILTRGAEIARESAEATMREVRAAMKLRNTKSTL